MQNNYSELKQARPSRWQEQMAFGKQLQEHTHSEAIHQKQHLRQLSFISREVMLGEEFKYPLGVFGFIARYSDNQELEVLLVYRPDYGIWNLPGGGIDPHEDPKTAVMREIHEETGLEAIASFSLFYIKDDPVKTSTPIGSETREDFFGVISCWLEGGNLKLNDESSDIRWFSVQNLPEGNLLFSRHRWAIKAIVNDSDLMRTVEDSIERHQLDVHQLEL